MQGPLSNSRNFSFWAEPPKNLAEKRPARAVLVQDEGKDGSRIFFQELQSLVVVSPDNSGIAKFGHDGSRMNYDG